MNPNDTQNKLFLPIAVVAAGLLIAGAVMWNGSRAPSAGEPGGTEPAKTVDITKIQMDGDPFIGRADAPVTIAFWSDFQCPFCQRFELETLPQIITNYVDTGKVKVVMLDFAFLGPDSTTAGLYNRSVWALYPTQYFAWRTAMYEAQDEEHGGFGDTASIDKLTATIAGIDAAKVAADVKANTAKYQAMLDADRAEAQKVGINATPSFVVGSEIIAGAYPFATFQTALDKLVN